MPLDPPRFDEEADFELWLAQFERYLRVSKTADDAQLDTLLLCAGNKAARYYDQMTWPPITDAERAIGVTEYSRAVSFLRLKFQPDRNEQGHRFSAAKIFIFPRRGFHNSAALLKNSAAWSF